MDTKKHNDLSNNVTQICESFNMLASNIDKIDRKIEDITKIFYKLSYNASLESSDTNSFLKFQIELLNVEKNYYSLLRRNIKSKFVTEMHEIGEHILMLLGSVDNIKMDLNREKENILKRVCPLKKNNELETSSIIENVNGTINNLELIKEFVEVFDKFINDTIENNRKENIHCNNFKVNLESKKSHILLEYKKFYNKLEELISYFLECTNELKIQLKNQKLLSFLTDRQ